MGGREREGGEIEEGRRRQRKGKLLRKSSGRATGLEQDREKESERGGGVERGRERKIERERITPLYVRQ